MLLIYYLVNCVQNDAGFSVMNAINAKINFVHVFLMKKIKFFAKKKILFVGTKLLFF